MDLIGYFFNLDFVFIYTTLTLGICLFCFCCILEAKFWDIFWIKCTPTVGWLHVFAHEEKVESSHTFETGSFRHSEGHGLIRSVHLSDPLRALELQPFSLKPLLRRALANESLERYRKAYVDYKMVLQIDNGVQAAHDSIHRLDEHRHKHQFWFGQLRAGGVKFRINEVSIFLF